VAKSAVVSALFALHPLHVESVAWVSERKDVLSTLFGFLAMLAYVRYAEHRKVSAYLVCLLFFALGLMAKPMLISLPFLLLLLDFWPLGALNRGARTLAGGGLLARALAEKVPFVALAAASASITFLAQSGGGAVKSRSLLENAANAGAAYLGYVSKMFWPAGLAVFYPYPPGSAALWKGLLALFAVGILTLGAVRLARRFPFLTVGWLWYVVSLLPVIGFVKIGDHAMADRYTYVPLVGLFLILVWGGEELGRALATPKKVLSGLALGLLAVCIALTNAQARHWRSSETLFRHALMVTDDNWIAHKNLAAALAKDGRLQEALFHANASLRLWKDPLEYVSQGWLYLQLGDYPRAAEACRNSLALMPDGNEKAYFVLGVASAHLGDDQTLSRSLDILRTTRSAYALQLAALLRDWQQR
jgi:tetratricopeptide (TPR) repeat protein